MIKNEIIIKLINLTIDQAEYFLKDAGEFYPFATVYSNDDNYKPIGICLDDENPVSILVLEELEKGLKIGFFNGEYKAIAIGVNTFINMNDKKVSAIEIQFASEKESLNCYIPYFLTENGELILENSFTTKGTLILN